jgi:hypothetical protein
MRSWRIDAARILAAMDSVEGLGRRCAAASDLLLGVRYGSNPLGGGVGRPERVRHSLAAFDCVTYVESVLALALSRTPTEFGACISDLRYGGNAPSWEHRLHYWSQWVAVQQNRGLLRIVKPPSSVPLIHRMLTTVSGIPPVDAKLRFHPWSPCIPSADLVGFGSERSDVDVFHVGILVGALLRHASRSAGRVVEEPLASFVSRERGVGMILARLGVSQ